ncbi:hypothetical protein SRB17_83440 [Streptomyces sp. RB17]|uniref:Mu transposase C-terminal domain-containing protein n=1 Tax=Streptomyces sp. RB17 TaxID=2585197 RepID=UPI0012960075|nr:Mu transposase C-terminal domain-containing protein [Streptomyces sp. RB17]MQY40311.1 hypothetical protein [Streptomyces sp. RB17]
MLTCHELLGHAATAAHHYAAASRAVSDCFIGGPSQLHCISQLFAALPGYTVTRSPRRGKKESADCDAPLPLTFTEFTAEVLAWITWWNTEHRPDGLSGQSPVEAWQRDLTPLSDIPEAAAWALMLEGEGRAWKLTSHGVRWRGRDYVGAWMAGQAGRSVRIRYIPHHDHGGW